MAEERERPVPLRHLSSVLALAMVTACQTPATSDGGKAATQSIGESTTPSAAPTLTPEVQAIDTTVGATFQVVLRGIPTTGYLWNFDAEAFKASVSLMRRFTVEPTPSDPPLLGAPTIEVFEFKALAPGRITLRFDLFRPWEGADKTIERRSVDVVIGE